MVIVAELEISKPINCKSLGCNRSLIVQALCVSFIPLQITLLEFDTYVPFGNDFRPNS